MGPYEKVKILSQGLYPIAMDLELYNSQSLSRETAVPIPYTN